MTVLLAIGLFALSVAAAMVVAWPFRRRQWSWFDAAFGAMVMGGYPMVPPPARKRRVEPIFELPDTQVVLASVDGDSLLLDCWVPDEGPRAFRAAPVPTAVRRSLTAGQALDMTLMMRGGTPVVEIDHHLTLELHPARSDAL